MTARINIYLDGTLIEAELNETKAAQAFAELLPITAQVPGTGIDFCGQAPFTLPYEESRVKHGWRNGDVNFNPGGDWLAILFDDEENSARYGDQVNTGHITNSLDTLHELSGSYNVRMEEARQMRTLALQGSARKQGRTCAMADVLIEGATSAGHVVVRFDVTNMNIAGCKGCEYCHAQAVAAVYKRTTCITLMKSGTYATRWCLQALFVMDRQLVSC